ncbi:MAG: hypothetical protein JSU85_10130 [Candidatus Zixiibacteriota bacterium]|nr:MAG: hypothetical protein JSU85_10130 [candidate division Zixibacteria bacterium]
MGNPPRLEGKIGEKIRLWFIDNGEEFVLCTREFCQGNRLSLRPLMDLLRDLAIYVFACDGNSLNDDLLDDLEYGIFDLIGRYTSTPGGDKLLESLQHTIIQHVTDMFADTKRRWNLNNFKITKSIEELDPFNDLIESPSKEAAVLNEHPCEPVEVQARQALKTMAIFAQKKFRGDKNRKIAVNVLENPDRLKDFPWMAELADSSIGSVKVTLTRIKQTLARNFYFKRLGSELYITQVREPTK